MPFIRHARDKRGYECTFVMHAYRSSASHPRVLYFFRTPSNVRVGRHPLDNEVMEALEHTHPDLAFDWPSLLRDTGAPRIEPRDRPQRPPRSGGHRPAEPSRPRPAPEPAPPPVQEDESVLGRTIGVREAARLRGQYQDLLQRIARRARTPEDRDRLTERLVRLNPDEWADAEGVKAGIASVEVEWTAIAEELPRRRRGRRGGRSREDGPGFQPSGIINEQPPKGELDDEETQELETGAPGASSLVHGGSDRADFSADASPEPAQPAEPAGVTDSAEAGAGDAAGALHPADGPGLPGDDRRHSD